MVLASKEKVQEEKVGLWPGSATEQQSLSWSKLPGGELSKSASSSGRNSKPNRGKALAGFNYQVPQEEEEEEAIEGCSQVSHLGQHTTGWESVTEVVVVGWLEKRSVEWRALGQHVQQQDG